MAETLQLTVTGMTCGGCENAVTRAVGRIPGVHAASASHVENRVVITFDEHAVAPGVIRTAIEGLGYAVEP